jgi:hypothetical protein
MNICVVNGSPRGAKGNTAFLTNVFLEGAAERGATSEVVYLQDKHIEHCCGNFTCWIRTPGECCRQDDMAEILEKIGRADVLVYATPLYTFTVSGLMKDFMDRIVPTIQPYISVKGGVSHHPRRDATSPTPLVISNCGFPEQSHFTGMKETFRQLFKHGDHAPAGMICCSGGESLRDPRGRAASQWYLDAMRQAGREVAMDLKVAPETQAILDRPLIEDAEIYARMANATWSQLGIEPVGDEAKALVSAAAGA